MIDLGDISWDSSTSHWQAAEVLPTKAFGDLHVEFKDFARSGVESDHYTAIADFLQNEDRIASQINKVMPEEAEFELLDQVTDSGETPDFTWSLASILKVDVKTGRLALFAEVSWDGEHLWEIEIQDCEIVGVGPM